MEKMDKTEIAFHLAIPTVIAVTTGVFGFYMAKLAKAFLAIL